jgi:hypothetical protein
MPKVGDIVGLRLDAVLEMECEPRGLRHPIKGDEWTILAEGWSSRNPNQLRFFIQNGDVRGWTSVDNVVERPKPTPQDPNIPLHLISHMKVVSMSLEDGFSAPKVILRSEDGHNETCFYAMQDEANHIHIGDEFTVTIARK